MAVSGANTRMKAVSFSSFSIRGWDGSSRNFPLGSMMPVSSISETRSIMPEPQMPRGRALPTVANAGAIIGIKVADLLHHVINILMVDLFVAKFLLIVHKAGRRNTAKIHDDLDQIFKIICIYKL